MGLGYIEHCRIQKGRKKECSSRRSFKTRFNYFIGIGHEYRETIGLGHFHKIIGDGNNFSCDNINTALKYPGSLLVAHEDTSPEVG